MIKQTLRSIRLGLGKALFDVPSPPADIYNLKKILLIRTDGKIGDHIVSSFVPRELKKFDPNIQVDVLATPKTYDLFANNHFIDNIYTLKNRKVSEYKKTGQELAKNKYDLVIDLTLVLRNRDLMLLTAIKARNYLGYHKENYNVFNINISKHFEQHYSEIYQLALQNLGISDIDTSYHITFDEKMSNQINDYLNQNKINKFVAVNFFGASSSRCFNDTKIKQILDNMQDIDSNIVLLSSNANYEHLKEITKSYSDIFVPKLENFFAVKSLLAKADLIITPDTSIVHLASALKKPLIAFYSEDQSNFNNWHPNNEARTKIIRFENNVNEIHIGNFKAILMEFVNLKTNINNSAITNDIYLAGGCFWGVEAFLKMIPGVVYTECGFANGEMVNPTYQDVVAGSGHAETVKVSYDPEKIDLITLLILFFKVIDPTSVNRQGSDVGIQYRTGIYYTDESLQPIVAEVLEELQKSYYNKIVVENKPLESYYKAEDYHQNYLDMNPNGYCHIDKALMNSIIDQYKDYLETKK